MQTCHIIEFSGFGDEMISFRHGNDECAVLFNDSSIQIYVHSFEYTEQSLS